MFRKKSDRHSPLKYRPLRQAGQSIDEEIEAFYDDKIATLMVMAGFVVAVAVMDWFRWLTHTPTMPVLSTIAAVLFAIYAAVRVIPRWKKLRELKQARDGEKIIAEHLDALREKGYRVLHDVVYQRPDGKAYNIDHVLIGGTGIFTIETKTISKPTGESEVTYDGEQVLVQGLEPDRDPIIQAKAEAQWVRDFVKSCIGKDGVPVRPVVLFPGWYTSKQPKGVEVWVLNEKALPVFVQNERGFVTQQDIYAIHFHLSQYVRRR